MENLIWAALAGFITAKLLISDEGPSTVSCGKRLKTMAPYCEDDPKCTWSDGKCKNINGDRYFKDDMFGNYGERAEAKKSFCRCVLHTMASGAANPYATCAASVGTSMGRSRCNYNFDEIPDDEVMAYASYAHKKGKLKGRSPTGQSVRTVRERLKAYNK